MNKKPLYRKVNTRARNHHHNTGGDARHDRHTKNGVKENMGKPKKRGLDYTPLFRFLLSKVGENWSVVLKEAQTRLDKNDPIFWMVDVNEPLSYGRVYGNSCFRSGENSYFSKLFVDDDNKLQLVDPEFRNEHLKPSCPCCTHTFNGKVLINKFKS